MASGVRVTGNKWNKVGVNHRPLAPERKPAGGALPVALTLLVKSSRTKVATLPLMPMKRFTLVRTT